MSNVRLAREPSAAVGVRLGPGQRRSSGIRGRAVPQRGAARGGPAGAGVDPPARRRAAR